MRVKVSYPVDSRDREVKLVSKSQGRQGAGILHRYNSECNVHSKVARTEYPIDVLNGLPNFMEFP